MGYKHPLAGGHDPGQKLKALDAQDSLGKVPGHCDDLVFQRDFVEGSAHAQPVLVFLLWAVSGHKA